MTRTSSCIWNAGLDLAGSNGEFGVYCVTGNQTTVDRLVLPSSGLDGPLPWEIVLLTDLVVLDLDGNLVSGSIPARINELTKLEEFRASFNLLSGSLPARFSPAIRSIDLNSNRLIGSIPATFGTTMRSLERLSVSGNELTGTIPASLGRIPVLVGFNFAENSFTGSIDSFLCTAGRTWRFLVADCDEVTCTCCTACCSDRTGGC